MSILTVLDAAATIDLTTLERAKQELGVTTNAQDAILTAWIHEVSRRIASACDWTFGLERVQELFRRQDLPGRNDIPVGICLAKQPVTLIESVTENGVLLTEDVHYEIEQPAGLLYRMTEAASAVRTNWHEAPVTVVYSGGYELLATLPYDLEEAALLLLRYRQSASGHDPMVRSKTIQDVGQWQYWVGNMPGQSNSLPPDVDMLLAPYRKLTLA